MRKIKPTSAFKKDLKRYRRQEDKLKRIYAILSVLEKGEPIPAQMKPHKLIGNYAGHMELHIESDLLLIWIEYDEKGEQTINLVRLGTHAELFGK